MANTFSSGQGASDIAPASLKTTPDKYVSLGDLIDPTKPDNRDLLVSTYGDQGITGFLTLTGAVTNAGTSDEVQWWEEGRLHATVTASLHAAGLNGGAVGELHLGAVTAIDGATADAKVRLNDVLLTPAGQRLVVTGIDDANDCKRDPRQETRRR